jgi:hypothetical protein
MVAAPLLLSNAADRTPKNKLRKKQVNATWNATQKAQENAPALAVASM